MQQAVLAAEDRHVLRARRLLADAASPRAVWNNLRGGSTAGRLDDHPAVRRRTPTSPRSARTRRKFKEFVIARQDGAAASRRTRSSRTTSTPSTSAAARTASRPRRARTSATTCKDLTPAQGAVLASIIRSPGGLLTREPPRPAAGALGDYVLDGDGRRGLARPAQRAGDVRSRPSRPEGRRPSGPERLPASTTVQAELAARRDSPTRTSTCGGLRVYTTFDKKAQRAAVARSTGAARRERQGRAHRARRRSTRRPARSSRCTAARTTASRSTQRRDAGDASSRVDVQGVHPGRRARGRHRAETPAGTGKSPVSPTCNGTKTKPIDNEDHDYGQIDPAAGHRGLDQHGRSSTWTTSRRSARRRWSRPRTEPASRTTSQIDPTLSARSASASPTASTWRPPTAPSPAAACEHKPTAVVQGHGRQRRHPLPAHPATAAAVRARTSSPTSTTRCSRSSRTAPGPRRAALGRPAAGKTGTHGQQPVSLVRRLHPAAVDGRRLFRTGTTADPGVPRRRRRLSTGSSAASFPARIWTAFMTAALQGKPVQKFPVTTLPTTVTAANHAEPDRPARRRTSATPIPDPVSQLCRRHPPVRHDPRRPAARRRPARRPAAAGAVGAVPGILTPGDRRARSGAG